MTAQRKIKIILVLALFVGLFAGPVLARRGFSNRGAGRSARIGASRGRSHGGSRFGRRRGLKRGSDVGHQRGLKHGSRFGRRRGLKHGSDVGHQRGLKHGSRFGRRRGLKHGSDVGHQRGLKHGSRFGRRRGLKRGSDVGHQRALRHGSRFGRHRGFKHGSRFGLRHFYYFSLPYRRYYYSYPGYYYYTEPYQRDDYDYPRDNAEVPDYDRFSDVREKIKRQETEKAAEEARVNRHLDNIAEAFATSDYAEAVLRASDAVNAEPDNTVLLFVYSQSVFASGEYNKAARLLREALRRVDPEKQEVFYPLGLYPDENILTEQIAMLSDAVEAETFKADLQLLMGYQLLGVGSFDEALVALQQAEQDFLNTKAAALLIEVLEKTRQREGRVAQVEKETKGIQQGY